MEKNTKHNKNVFKNGIVKKTDGFEKFFNIKNIKVIVKDSVRMYIIDLIMKKVGFEPT